MKVNLARPIVDIDGNPIQPEKNNPLTAIRLSNICIKALTLDDQHASGSARLDRWNLACKIRAAEVAWTDAMKAKGAERGWEDGQDVDPMVYDFRADDITTIKSLIDRLPQVIFAQAKGMLDEEYREEAEA